MSLDNNPPFSHPRIPASIHWSSPNHGYHTDQPVHPALRAQSAQLDAMPPGGVGRNECQTAVR